MSSPSCEISPSEASARREKTVVRTSVVGILVNLILASAKVVAGLAASSISVVSEGVNNAADVASSVLTVVGTKLARKHPTKSHPFGFGRVEYITSLVIAVLILLAGAEFLVESVKRVFRPAEMDVSYLTLAIVVVSAAVKFALGVYTLRKGKAVGSGTLEAVGVDSRNDAFISIVTVVSALVFLLTGVSIDAYAGVVMSVVILRAGLGILLDTLGSILGRAADKELADMLYREIRATPGVLNAADMMLHNYGPDRYTGSVNIEMDHEKTVGELYTAIHRLQLDIMHRHGVTMVFGIYAVAMDHAEHKKLYPLVGKFVREHEHVKSFHAIYIPEDERKIYCDLVVDYELKSWDALRKEFSELIKREYPDYALELVIETEYV